MLFPNTCFLCLFELVQAEPAVEELSDDLAELLNLAEVWHARGSDNCEIFGLRLFGMKLTSVIRTVY